jgi:hypothetical protein
MGALQLWAERFEDEATLQADRMAGGARRGTQCIHRCEMRRLFCWVCILKRDRDKASLVACLMLHLRSRYVSKAAILTVPVRLVLVENRSPA